MTTANRGKSAEAAVKKYLAKRSETIGFNFMRLPDARSGSFQPTTADFLAVSWGKPYFIEVKEVNHAFRLPSKNFGRDQRARLRAFELAGALARILVFHTPTKAWRALLLDHFEDDPPSWDLRHQPEITLDEAMTVSIL